MSGTDIFLSYARHDRGTARIIADCLADEGFSVWWDASLHSGETFDEVIERNLRDAKAVVVLWSPASVASRWVRAEATLADRRDKLAPAIIQPCDRPIIFELTHTADLCDWSGDAADTRWRTFVSDLQRLVDPDSEHQRVPSPRSQPAPAKRMDPPPSRFPPANRGPLRPGSNEVIFADRARREQPVRLPTAPEPVAEEPFNGEVHCLEVEAGDLPEELIVVDTSGMKIGRTAPADIVLSHKSVSREHCMIGLANDELLVSDLNSTNGTYVDDVRISRATIVPVGSVLRVGQISMSHAVRPYAEAARHGQLDDRGNGRGLQTGRLAASS